MHILWIVQGRKVLQLFMAAVARNSNYNSIIQGKNLWLPIIPNTTWVKPAIFLPLTISVIYTQA